MNLQLSWQDWAIADILRSEAAELLGIAEPKHAIDPKPSGNESPNRNE
jgi:hypothetical protein